MLDLDPERRIKEYRLEMHSEHVRQMELHHENRKTINNYHSISCAFAAIVFLSSLLVASTFENYEPYFFMKPIIYLFSSIRIVQILSDHHIKIARTPLNFHD